MKTIKEKKKRGVTHIKKRVLDYKPTGHRHLQTVEKVQKLEKKNKKKKPHFLSQDNAPALLSQRHIPSEAGESVCECMIQVAPHPQLVGLFIPSLSLSNKHQTLYTFPA